MMANRQRGDRSVEGSEQAHTRFSFGPFDAAKVQGYDRWPYGLQGRTGGYAARLSEDQLKRQLVERSTTYLLGQVDMLPLGGFDGSPPAMAQGATRRQRGEAFVSYINGHLGAKAQADHRPGVRPQRPLRIHDRLGVARDLPAAGLARCSAVRVIWTPFPGSTTRLAEATS